mmetsp:Transcript_99962/g.188103  ORF Transcript_99962/g.188103 Transcript_99962/m.188103 type:complete len:286 (+) Transcript_99962:1152-2009(+)
MAQPAGEYDGDFALATCGPDTGEAFPLATKVDGLADPIVVPLGLRRFCTSTHFVGSTALPALVEAGMTLGDLAGPCWGDIAIAGAGRSRGDVSFDAAGKKQEGDDAFALGLAPAPLPPRFRRRTVPEAAVRTLLAVSLAEVMAGAAGSWSGLGRQSSGGKSQGSKSSAADGAANVPLAAISKAHKTSKGNWANVARCCRENMNGAFTRKKENAWSKSSGRRNSQATSHTRLKLRADNVLRSWFSQSCCSVGTWHGCKAWVSASSSESLSTDCAATSRCICSTGRL